MFGITRRCRQRPRATRWSAAKAPASCYRVAARRRRFGALVAQAVDRYREAVSQDPSHPFLADIPDRFRFTAWGVILDEGAYQVPHIHPSAWLSGVYYVALPSSLGADDDGTAGWIEFGRPYWDFQIRAEPETRLIEPEEGLMLLFPSYMFHRTLPFTGPGERISIAFDVLRGE